jgi:hypothetical protein
MHHCHMSHDFALYELSLARGYQYIHAALLSQGAHCVRPQEASQKFDCLMDAHDSIMQAYQETEYDNGY